MRKHLYVAGPVLHPSLGEADYEAMDRIYSRIREWCKRNDVDVTVPTPDPELAKLDPGAFFGAIRDQIRVATHVVTVVTVPAVAAGGEAILASSLGKPHAILYSDERRVSRFLCGAPGFVGWFTFSKIEEFLPAFLFQ